MQSFIIGKCEICKESISNIMISVPSLGFQLLDIPVTVAESNGWQKELNL